MAYPIPKNEAERIRSLSNVEILDTARDPDFDNLIAIVQNAFNVPMAAVSLIDTDRQWFKTSIGLAVTQTSRDAAFCSHTICSDTPLIVPDATRDNRFDHNPLVRGEPHIRCYAGVSLAVEPGLNVGSLCIIDNKPRKYGTDDIRYLRHFGDLAQTLLKSHWATQALAVKSDALEHQLRMFDQACDLAKMGGFEKTIATDDLRWTRSMFDLHEMDSGSPLDFQQLLTNYPPSDRKRLLEAMDQARRTGTAFTFEGRIYTSKGNLKWIRMISDVEIKDGVEVRRFGMKQDITEERNLRKQNERLANQDDLTGLLNRRGFRSRLTHLGAAEASSPSSVSLFSFDLDGFKNINDAFGHAAGDACLRRIARRAKVVVKITAIWPELAAMNSLLCVTVTTSSSAMKFSLNG